MSVLPDSILNAIENSWPTMSYSGCSSRLTRSPVILHEKFPVPEFRCVLRMAVPVLTAFGADARLVELWSTLSALIRAVCAKRLLRSTFEQYIQQRIVAFRHALSQAPISARKKSSFRKSAKYHFMSHFIEVLRAEGPSHCFSAQAHESQHKEIRKHFKNSNNHRYLYFALKRQALYSSLAILYPETFEEDELAGSVNKDFYEIAGKTGLPAEIVRDFLLGNGLEIDNGRVTVSTTSLSERQVLDTTLFAIVEARDGSRIAGLVVLVVNDNEVVVRKMSKKRHEVFTYKHSLRSELVFGTLVDFFFAFHLCDGCSGSDHRLSGSWISDRDVIDTLMTQEIA